MKKTLSWILLLLLFVSIGCRKTAPTPVMPSASPDAQSASPSASATMDTPAPSPVRDASFREYSVTYPSRGVQVHATVVLPGSTTVGNSSASASPDASALPSGSPDAAQGSALPSGSPDAAQGSTGSAGSSDAAAGAGSADASAGGEGNVLSSPGATDGEMHVLSSPDATDGEMHAYGSPDASDAPVVMPGSAQDPGAPEGGWPLVVFLHGHGGERNENGGFSEIAHELARHQIASIRMDFAGSGESEEAFTENTLTSMYEDALAAIDFAKQTYPIDEEAIGVFGFDMGGRVALHLIATHLFDFRAAVLLAPTDKNEDLITMFGGREAWERYKADAELNNYTTFTTVYGQVQDLSVRWFSDLEAADDPAALAEQSFRDRALVIYATNDTTVSPDVSRYVAEKLGAETVQLETGGHSYGFYADSEDLLERIAQTSAEFFDRTLTAR